MIKPLRPGTVETIKATVPALEAHGVTITKTMYERLMQSPHIAAMFNQTDQANGRQSRALADAVLAYARHIERPESLDSALALIAERHVGLSVAPEHYPIVGEALIDAIDTVLGDAATPEIIEAWRDAYRFLAEILIQRETALYRNRESAPGGWRGWRGWRRFRVTSRVQESADVVSFWLSPIDGKPTLRHEPGQFLTFALTQADLNTRRSYSISSAPNDQNYRISIKRDPHGHISRWFHDHVHENHCLDVAPPAGNFTRAQAKHVPVLLVSGGIGITPLMSMALSHTQSPHHLPMRFVHATRATDHTPFLRELTSMAQKSTAITIDLFASTAQQTQNASYFNCHNGRISASWLFNHMDDKTHVFLCGPRSLQQDLMSGLKALGVAPSRIHHEFYGPNENLAA